MSRSIRDWRLIAASAALTALAAAAPARAAAPPTTTQPGKGHASSPPSSSRLPHQGIAGPATGTTPLAVIMDASLLTPGSAALTVAALGWQGTDASEVDVPVIGVAVGVAPRFQLGVSVPYTVGNDAAGVAGGWGTTYFTGKIGIVQNDAAGVKLAVAPTIQVLGAGVLSSLSSSESRVTWGLPVSAEVDSGAARLFASGGYFSGGIGFAGGGIGVQASPRMMISGSFSHAWSSGTSTTSVTSATGTATPATTDVTNTRSEVFAGLSIAVAPHVGVFGSVGRTIGTTEANGAGLTIVGGVSLLAGPSGSRP
ncbi:MAG: hypothetical protein HY048_19935 [Acidobacteria bacterium]|nr:hypothetical protein [Acidobacteriota bacterium]